jgi:hypothetical protein
MATRRKRNRSWIGWIIVGVIVLGLLALALSSLEEDESSASTPPREPPVPTRTTTKPTVAPTRTANAPDSSSGADDQADWTVLVYLDGDNDLEEEAIGDYAEMASVGSSATVNIVVQFDRIASSEDWDATSRGNWSSVKRFRVERGKQSVKSNQLADLGELNMGDPRTLVDFATWGIQTYPAEHYALIFWDHGAAWPGVASDDSSDGDMLTLPELAEALAELRQRTGVQKLDLIGFDACLMGQIDVLQAVAPFGEVAIGSADLVPGEGWAWNAWLKDLIRKPPKSAAALAPSIIESFSAFYEKEDDPSVTIAAFDLAKVDQMTDQLDALASAMIETMPKSYAAIGKARSYAAEYASGDTDISAIDLGYFADSLVTAGADRRVVTAARALSRTIKAARIAAGFGADHSKSTGISVYFPWKKKHYDTSYVESSPMTTATRWDEFLQLFYKSGRGNAGRSTISPTTLNQLAATPDTPLTLAATISGADTAHVYYFVGALDPSDPGMVQVLSMDYIYPPGATLGDAIPAWHSGDEVQLTWKSTSWYISNGVDVVLAPFNPIDYGANTYSVEGTYTRRSGTRIPVSIEFTVTQGHGTLQHIWAFDTGGSANPRPRELKPRPGDTFTPTIASFATQNHDDQRIGDGTAITFGSAPLVAFEAMVPSGNYTLGLMVEDIAGEVATQYADVTVANPRGTAPPAVGAAAGAVAGATAGTLTYRDQELAFQIDYPQEWKISSPGIDKVIFAASGEGRSELTVDVYALEGGLRAANQAMIEDLLDTSGSQPGFALRRDPKNMRIANHEGLRVEYVYQNRDGELLYVVGIAVSDQAAEATYLITFETPAASFAGRSTMLDAMLKTFQVAI